MLWACVEENIISHQNHLSKPSLRARWALREITLMLDQGLGNE